MTCRPGAWGSGGCVLHEGHDIGTDGLCVLGRKGARGRCPARYVARSDGRQFECDLPEQHGGPHRAEDFDERDESFRTVVWMGKE